MHESEAVWQELDGSSMIRQSRIRNPPLIDNRDQVERLLGKLAESLPLSALVTPALMATLRGRSSTTKITWNVRSPRSCIWATRAESCAT